jgi:hypothetical protein
MMMIYFSNSITIKNQKTKLTQNTNCASENQSCNLPGGKVCSVAYGSDSRWAQRHGLVGSIGCNNGVFGDPFWGRVKHCYYYDCKQAFHCSGENGACNLPANHRCQVTYGINSGFSIRTATNSIGCNNGVFGDPKVGTYKHCYYYGCAYTGNSCAGENGACSIPGNKVCTVRYGIDNRWTQKQNLYGNIGCNNGVFGDPAVGTGKVCVISDCQDFNGCAHEGQNCVVPNGQQCSIQYGNNGKFAVRPYVQNSIGCNNGVFGDPFPGVFKQCKLIDCKTADTHCAAEHGSCKLPAGQRCSIRYGVDTRWTSKSPLEGAVPCENSHFGDPAVGTVKACFFFGCTAIPPPPAPLPPVCPLPTTPTFNQPGVIFDATTNEKIPLNIVNAGSPVVQYIELFADEKTHTAQVVNGAWNIKLVKGQYRRVVSLKGWSTRITEINVQGAGEPFPHDRVLLSPAVDGWRVVLTWGAKPKDLDAHVRTNNGTDVSFHKKKFKQGDSEVYLDVDNTNGFGPETITLKKVKGIHKFYVHNYSNDVPLSSSQAKVVLYRGAEQVSEVKVPQGSGDNTIWTVYEINADNKTFKLVNTFESLN